MRRESLTTQMVMATIAVFMALLARDLIGGVPGTDAQWPPDSVVLYFDDFENGDVSDWQNHGGIWTVEDGHLDGVGQYWWQYLVAPFTGCDRCFVETRMMVPWKTCRANLTACFRDADNFVALWMSPKSQLWTLAEYVGGAQVASVCKRSRIKPKTWYRVGLSLKGRTIKVYVDGHKLITCRTATPPSSGTVGLGFAAAGSSSSGAASFEYITVKR